MLDYCYKACEFKIKEQIVEIAVNSSGTRDTAQVLKINKNTDLTHYPPNYICEITDLTHHQLLFGVLQDSFCLNAK